MRFFIEGADLLPPRPRLLNLTRSLVGGSLGILTLLLLTKYSGNAFIMAPFGASCVLLFAVPDSPLAQPRNVIFGHLIAAFVGLIFLYYVGTSIWSIAFSVGIAICAMYFLRCTHPPAGANPLVVLLTAEQLRYGWDFLVFPVLLGSLALVIVAVIVNNGLSKNSWPKYWFALIKTSKSGDETSCP